VVSLECVDEVRDRGVYHPLRLGLQLFPALERVQSLRVDDLALLVHDVVELQQLLSRLEILELDALLRLADGGCDPRMGNDLTLFGAGAVHDPRAPVAPEERRAAASSAGIETAL